MSARARTTIIFIVGEPFEERRFVLLLPLLLLRAHGNERGRDARLSVLRLHDDEAAVTKRSRRWQVLTSRSCACARGRAQTEKEHESTAAAAAASERASEQRLPQVVRSTRAGGGGSGVLRARSRRLTHLVRTFLRFRRAFFVELRARARALVTRRRRRYRRRRRCLVVGR